MKRYFGGFVFILIIWFNLQATNAQTETVVTRCDYQHFVKALAIGGSIILECNQRIQIWPNRPLTIAADISIKPAEGRSVTFEAIKGRVFIINAGVSLSLEDVIVQGNPNNLGGGIENNGGKLSVTHVTFISNDGASGAAIDNHTGGSAAIANSVFIGNSTFGGGGAVINDDTAEMVISGSSFTNNHSWSDSNGGAILNRGTLTINTSIFAENNSQGRFGWGGAIYNTGNGILEVNNSTFAHNTAGHSGAAIRTDGKAQANITFSTFIENATEVWGGALYTEGGTLTVNNSLFSQNTADGTASDCAATLNLGTIIADHNLSNAGCGDVAATGVATLANNGGSTRTVAIASDSNAIDAASGCPQNAVDQRGTPRPQGQACDIGAYEYVELTAAATAVSICQVTTTRDIRLRAEPNTASKILAVVTHGLTFQAIEQITGWYHITYNTVDGWISADFVMTKGDCGA